MVCGGAKLLVTLRGVALKQDKYEEERTELEVLSSVLCSALYDTIQYNMTCYMQVFSVHSNADWLLASLVCRKTISL